MISVEEFKNEVSTLAEQVGVEPKEIHVRKLKRKWGSCSIKGRLTFGLALLEQPRTKRREIVLHDRQCHANLEGALLMGTDLRNATLRNATCVGCNCPMANFAQADLTGVNFRGANLANANVSREQLSKVGMLRGAILPDGQLYDGSLDLAGDRQEAKNRGIDPEDTKRFKEYFLYSPEDEDFFWFRLFRKSFDRQQRGN